MTISVIGMDVEKAVKIIEKEGLCCAIKEYSVKKQAETGRKRVIRQKSLDARTVELLTAAFKTEI
jgi:hypothetical protein